MSLLASCQGGGAAAPSGSPTPSAAFTVTVVSGAGGAPVSGARVVLGDRTLVTTASGETSIPEGTPDGAFIDILAPGFLDRQTLVRRDESRISLWPATSGTLDADFTATVVYSPSVCPAQNSPSLALRRHASTTTSVLIVFAPSLQDARAAQAHAEAASRLSAATGGRPIYSVADTAPSSSVVFTALIDPGAPTCTAGSEPLRASTTTAFTNGAITGGTLTYCSLEAARSTDLVLHELGHTYGLTHAPSAQDVMWCTSGRPSQFSPREALAMSLMKLRRPGTRFPDDDRAATGALGEQRRVFDCGAR